MSVALRSGFFLVACLFLAYMFFSFQSFVLRGGELVENRYVEQAAVDFMERLITNGWIVKGASGPILTDEAIKHLSNAEKYRVQRLLGGIKYVEGAFRFDARFVSVVHPGISQGRMEAMRGRILDRHGRLLAGVDRSGGRYYPLGPAAFHVVGYGGDMYPKTGLEGVFDNSLRPGGAPWWRWFWRGEGGFGADLVLTIDSEIQRVSYNSIAGRSGAVVVLNPRNGDVLAMVSSPSFDPNLPPGRSWESAVRDKSMPMFNRAIVGLYPPGSIFKLVVAAAGFAEGDSPVMDLPRRDRNLAIGDHRAFGLTNFSSALADSSNVYFARWGVSLGPRLLDMCEKFGFRKPIIIAEASGGKRLEASESLAFFQGTPPVFFSELDFRRNPRLVAQGSIGQNIVLATPLQMAMVTGAFAHGGAVLRPRIVACEPETPPHFLSKPVLPSFLSQIVQAMCAVVDEGTAKKLPKIYKTTSGYSLASEKNARRIRVAAKTGTAEVQGQTSHAWFVCFAPDEPFSPVVCVLLENAGYGASNAGPVGTDVLVAALNAMGKEEMHELSDSL